jgi:polyhydroxybutyrate depolymerase
MKTRGTKRIYFFLVFLLSIMGTACTREMGQCDRIYTIEDSLKLDGLTRTFTIHLPENYYDFGKKLPLVIGIHGTGGNARQFAEQYAFSRKADEAGFIAVYPEGVKKPGVLGLRTWNAGTCCDFAAENNIRDVEFIRLLSEQLAEKYNVDGKRIYLVGISNGGMLAYRLAAELKGKFTAMAVVSGTMMTESFPADAELIPILHIHSIKDEKVPYTGGVGIGGYYFTNVDSVLNKWAEAGRCSPGKTLKEESELYSKWEWTPCAQGSTVNLYLTNDGGHSWPGGVKSRPAADAPSRAFNATDLIWDFLSKHKK